MNEKISEYLELMKNVLFKPLACYSIVVTVALLVVGSVMVINIQRGQEARREIEAISVEKQSLETSLAEIKNKTSKVESIAKQLIVDVRKEAESFTNSVDDVPLPVYIRALDALDASDRFQIGLRDEIDALEMLRRADARDAKARDKKALGDQATGILIAGGAGLLIGGLLVAIIKK